jgi:hypothetical protein
LKNKLGCLSLVIFFRQGPYLQLSGKQEKSCQIKTVLS